MSTKEQILAAMKDKAITSGWKVVCALSEERITDLFMQKHNAEDHAGLAYKIDVQHKPNPGSLVTLRMEVGPPIIQFIRDLATQCKMDMEIKNATLTLTYFDETGRQTDTQVIQGTTVTSYHNEIKTEERILPESCKIMTVMELTKVQGSLSEIKDTDSHSVVVNLRQGSFSLVGLNMEESVCNALSNEVQIFFKKNLNNYCYSLGTIKYAKNSVCDALTPVTFDFATTVELDSALKPIGGALVLFIDTKSDGQPGTRRILSIDYPIPDGFQAAVIISSKLLFRDLLLPKLKKIFTTNLQAKDPGIATQPWSIEGINSLSVGKIDEHQNQDVCVPLRKFTVKSTNNALALDWKDSWEQEAQYKKSNAAPGGGGIEFWTNGTIDLDISTTESKWTTSVVEPNEEVTISSTNQVSIDVHSAFWDSYGIKHCKQYILDKVASELNKLSSISVPGISVFAVSNLLFPESHILSLQEAYIPGDLVIFGGIKKSIG